MNERYLPMRLSQDLAIQHIGDETLVYDERRHMAFCLNRVAAAVWAECNGVLDASQIAAKVTLQLAHPVSTAVVESALAQFSRDCLLRISASAPVTVPGLSRRSLMARAGAGAVMMLPVVAAVMAPRAAQAYNGGVDLPGDDPAHDGSIPADPGAPNDSPSGGSSSFTEEPK